MSASHKPSVFMLLARIALLTMLATVLSFAIGLLFGIIGIVVRNSLGTSALGLDQAYKHIALPIAATVFVIALAMAAVNETRVYRRQKQEWRSYPRAA